MSEFLQNGDKDSSAFQDTQAFKDTQKEEQLKDIIKKLHAGSTVHDLKQEFGDLLKDLSAEEIASMEQSLVNEGFPVSSIQDLCEVHVEVFEESLMNSKDEAQLDGHPVYTYRQEILEAENRLADMDEVIKGLKKSDRKSDRKFGKETAEKSENKSGKKFGRKPEKQSTRKLDAASGDRTTGESGSQGELYDILREKLQDLMIFEKHFQRKENQLFPKLENTGFTGPTTVMWGKHDEIRDAWKALRNALNAPEPQSPKELKKLYKTLKGKLEKMFFMERKILYPTSLKKLTPLDWAAIRAEEPEIGYSWVAPGSIWDPSIAIKRYAEEHGDDAGAAGAQGGLGAQASSGLPNIADYMRPSAKASAGAAGSSDASGSSAAPHKKGGLMDNKPILIPLNEGFLTQEQLDLLLRNLPFDVTYVDENDKVRYYSATDDRVFPRTPSIIGRDVEKCHPPKSVHVVEKIVTAFKNRERDKAEFWLNFQGRVIHIRYFPIFDENKDYRGVIEVSQDITDIQKLTGEHRLLDWE